MPPVTILVNSSDGFEDCWHPFFELFGTYWPSCAYPILLNTELKTWQGPLSLDVRCTQVAQGAPARLTWSECLIAAIDRIETPLLLYFQEDYFVDHAVRTDVIDRAVAMMLADPAIGHIQLTKHGSHGPWSDYPEPGYRRIGQNAKYRISTQAALWRPSVLKSYLEPSENGWMFEILGSLRARRRNDVFLVAADDPLSERPAIDYVHTGIMKGQWHPAMPQLFADHAIAMNFATRGFYRNPGRLVSKWQVVRKLAQNPGHVARQLFGSGQICR